MVAVPQFVALYQGTEPLSPSRRSYRYKDGAPMELQGGESILQDQHAEDEHRDAEDQDRALE